jgi:hypothetical protein
MELSFAKAQAQTNNATFAAWQAGYSYPAIAGAKLARSPAIQDHVRQETQRFLFDHAGSIACQVLATIALDEKMPAGARVKSATELARLANIAISDDIAGKPEHELTASELDELRRKLESQRNAVESVLARMPSAAIDSDPGHSVLD